MQPGEGSRADLYVRVAALAVLGVVIGMARERFLAGKDAALCDATLILMPLAAFATQALHYRLAITAALADTLAACWATLCLAVLTLPLAWARGLAALGVYVLVAWIWATRTRREIMVRPERELRHYLQHAGALAGVVSVGAAAALGAVPAGLGQTRSWILAAWVCAMLCLLTSKKAPCPAAPIDRAAAGIWACVASQPQASMLFAVEGAANAAGFILTLGYLGMRRVDLAGVAGVIVAVQLGGAALQLALKGVVARNYRSLVVCAAGGVVLLGVLMATAPLGAWAVLAAATLVGALVDQVEPARLRAALARMQSHDSPPGRLDANVVLGRELALMLGRVAAISTLLLVASRSWALALVLASAVIAAEAWLLLRVLASPAPNMPEAIA